MDDWLDSYVDWMDSEEIPRRVALSRFLQHGLIPWVHSRGYRIRAPLRLLGSRIATGLWVNRGLSCLESNWRFGNENIDYIPEERWHFNDKFDSEGWEGFWEAWGNWGDFSLTTSRGDDRRIDLQEYIWTQIDLENSPQTKELCEILGIDFAIVDDGEPVATAGRGGRKEDMYLREAKESGEWGGWRR
jgi:hypothetical protein